MVCGIDRVYESLPIPRITRVPGTKNFILGLANVRGNLMTVIDLGCYLRANGRTIAPAAQDCFHPRCAAGRWGYWWTKCSGRETS